LKSLNQRNFTKFELYPNFFFLPALLKEACEGKVTQLYSGFSYEELFKNGVDSSYSTTGNGCDPETPDFSLAVLVPKGEQLKLHHKV